MVYIVIVLCHCDPQSEFLLHAGTSLSYSPCCKINSEKHTWNTFKYLNLIYLVNKKSIVKEIDIFHPLKTMDQIKKFLSLIQIRPSYLKKKKKNDNPII